MIVCGKDLKTFGKLVSRLAESDSGSALVELAISSTIILGTFIAVFQLTMACYTYNSVAEVARDSARWAAVRGATCSQNTPTLDHCGATATDIQNYAKSVSALNWSQCTTASPCLTVTWKTASMSGIQHPTTTWSTCSSGCKKVGDMVTVSMTYPYAMNLPFLRNYNLTLGSASTMIVAQ